MFSYFRITLTEHDKLPPSGTGRGFTMSKQQGHAVKNTQTKSSDKKGNSSGNNH